MVSSFARHADPGRVFPVDCRLVAPESRYEVEDGKVLYVSPADEIHATRHSKVSALLEAHVGAEHDVASDMLTRTSELDDVAPDASVFPVERDPATGGRRLEELAFQVVSTEKLGDAGRKAQKLSDRGVRRIFAVDVARDRTFEWSTDLGTWEILARDAKIGDRCFAVPLPVEALLGAAKADDAMARALLAKRNAVLVAALDEKHAEGRAQGKAEGKIEGKAEGKIEGKAEGKIEGKAEAIIAVLEARGLPLASEERQRILATRDARLLQTWLAVAATCREVGDLFVHDLTPKG